MKRYAAFLRGVSPMNASMPELKQAFERAGFGDVKTILSSGNVVFSASSQAEGSLAAKAEKAMKKHLGSEFMTIVRPVEALRQLLAADPFAEFDLPSEAKRVVTFLRERPRASARSQLKLPVELHGAQILAVQGSEVFSAYVRSPKGAVFMTLIEKTFGKDVTTRTWDTVKKVAK